MVQSAKTPCGLSPILLVIYYSILLSFCGYAIGASEPMKELLRMRGVLPQMSEKERELILSEVTNTGVVVSIFGACFFGAFSDYFGPKVTAVLGQFGFILGYILLFFSPVTSTLALLCGCCCLGGGFLASFVSHTSVGALFPERATLVLAIIGSGPDVSLFVPTVLKDLATKTGDLQLVVKGYIAICFLFLISECFLVPWKRFEHVSEVHAVERPESLVHEISEQTKVVPYSRLSFLQQLGTPHYWIFMIFAAFSMFRKCHFQQLGAQIIQVAGDKSGAAPESTQFIKTLFNKLLMFAFVPALGLGAFTDYFGVVPGIILVNAFGVVLYVLSSIPNLYLQIASIFCFNAMASYIFGIIFAFIASNYGFATLNTLQGLQFLFCGLAALLFNPWNRYFVQKLPNILYSNAILAVLGVFIFAVPLYLYLRPVPREAAPTGKTRGETTPLLQSGGSHRVSSAWTRGGPMDRSSLLALQQEERKGEPVEEPPAALL